MVFADPYGAERLLFCQNLLESWPYFRVVRFPRRRTDRFFKYILLWGGCPQLIDFLRSSGRQLRQLRRGDLQAQRLEPLVVLVSFDFLTGAN